MLSFPSNVDSLIYTFLFALLLKFTYSRFSRDISDRVKFSTLLVLLAVITTIIISVIKDSLALSLGLVGALSIVRFRAPIKDPEQLVYLFAALAIGIGVGAGAVKYTGVATLFVSILIVVFSGRLPFKLGQGDTNSASIVGKFTVTGNQKLSMNELSAFISKQNIKHVFKNSCASNGECSFSVFFFNSTLAEIEQLIFDLKEMGTLLPDNTKHELWNMSTTQLVE